MLFADLQLQLLSALGFQQRGEHRLALDLVRNAVTTACPENGLRRLLDAGPALQPLYAELQREESASGDSIGRQFLADLLAASQVRRASAASEQAGPAAHAARGVGALIEALSSRELQILEWMARGDSNAVIRAHLLISENTVKRHVKNVFAKLGVNNRTAAVMAAQQHQLLT
jgi:LuxR family maltose regulon positive regulatory protein